jgi:hypothetical protein
MTSYFAHGFDINCHGRRDVRALAFTLSPFPPEAYLTVRNGRGCR